MSITVRVDLTVPYVEKDDAKALGARWDKDRKVWYAPAGIDLSLLDRWLPGELTPPGADGPPVTSRQETGVTLKDLLGRVRSAVEAGLPEAVWVRAEVSELRSKNGQIYLHLAERNDRGDVLAQCKAAI